jgi:hypothetical protein
VAAVTRLTEASSPYFFERLESDLIAVYTVPSVYEASRTTLRGVDEDGPRATPENFLAHGSRIQRVSGREHADVKMLATVIQKIVQMRPLHARIRDLFSVPSETDMKIRFGESRFSLLIRKIPVVGSDQGPVQVQDQQLARALRIHVSEGKDRTGAVTSAPLGFLASAPG